MKKKFDLSFEGRDLLSREQMKALIGGHVSTSMAKDGGAMYNDVCYQCCTPDFGTCGACDYSGNGGCQGNGVAVSYCCAEIQ